MTIWDNLNKHCHWLPPDCNQQISVYFAWENDSLLQNKPSFQCCISNGLVLYFLISVTSRCYASYDFCLPVMLSQTGLFNGLTSRLSMFGITSTKEFWVKVGDTTKYFFWFLAIPQNEMTFTVKKNKNEEKTNLKVSLSYSKVIWSDYKLTAMIFTWHWASVCNKLSYWIVLHLTFQHTSCKSIWSFKQSSQPTTVRLCNLI